MPTGWPTEGPPLEPSPELFYGHPRHREVWLDLDGRELHLRPVRPTDAAAIDRFVRRLSTETRFKRFHTAVRRLTPGQLAVLVDVDHRDRETLLAVVEGDIVGIGQYVRDGQGHAEVAVVVTDRWQRRGVGRALSRHLGLAAAEAGISALGSHVLPDNRAPVRLARSLSDCVSVEDRSGVVDLTVQLAPC